MAPVLKTGIPETVSGVRIPPSPPYTDFKHSKDVRQAKSIPSIYWGFRVLASDEVRWKPMLGGGICGGTQIFPWGYFKREHSAFRSLGSCGRLEQV
jgi:hypothetical protein